MPRRNTASDPLVDAAHVLIRGIDLADEANRSLPAGFRDRDGVTQLDDMDSDKCFSRNWHGSSSCSEERLGPSEQPSDAKCRASRLTRRGGHTVFRLRRLSGQNGVRSKVSAASDRVDGTGSYCCAGCARQSLAKR